MAEPQYIREIMTSPVHIVTASVTVRTTMEIMLERNIHAMPLVDVNGHLQGIVSGHDLVVLAGLGMHNYKLGELPAKLKVHKPVVKVYVDELIKTALLKIAKNKVGQVVVVDQNERCVGIVANADLMRFFLKIEHGLTVPPKPDEA